MPEAEPARSKGMGNVCFMPRAAAANEHIRKQRERIIDA
jgi:hypothetical protein